MFSSGLPPLRFCTESSLGFRLVVWQNSDKLECEGTKQRCLHSWVGHLSLCLSNATSQQAHQPHGCTESAWNQTVPESNWLKAILLPKELGITFVLLAHLPLSGCHTEEICAADLGFHKPRDYVPQILTGPCAHSLANTTIVISSLR